jgi:general secretion pathway protein F
MPAFEYTALNVKGRREKGVLEGDTARQVRQLLRDQGLTPLDVEEIARRRETSAALSGVRFGRINATDLALLTRHLATLLRAGAPLEEALANVARQSRRNRIKSVVLAVRSRVMEGHSLAAGLADFPGVFPEIYRATVDAGEESGHLERVLDRLADYTEARQVMRQKVGTALFYPVLLTVMAVLVLAGLLGYVVPQVVQVFENLGQELPLLTRGLIRLSELVRDYGLWAGAGILLALGMLRQLLKREALRYKAHRLVLSLPVIGGLVRGLNSARFARTLSILSASGVPILQALSISSRVVPNLPMRRAVETVASRVREGSLIHRALEQTGYFPPMTVYLIANGEASGQLQEMLERAAVQQERETDMTIATALALFEPLLIMAMGGVVLIIVMAILLPIFELNQLVS